MLGLVVGRSLGATDGSKLGLAVGLWLGATDGSWLGLVVGRCVGATEGIQVGRELGREETDRSVSVSVSEQPPSPLWLRDSMRRVSRPVDADLPPRIIFRMNSW